MAMRKPLSATATGELAEVPAVDSLQMPAAAVFAAEHDNVDSGSAATIDFALGQKQRITLTADATLTLAEPPGVGHYQLKALQDSTGGRSLTLTGDGYSDSRWLNRVAPGSPNPVASGETLYNFYWDGAQWYLASAWVGAVEQ